MISWGGDQPRRSRKTLWRESKGNFYLCLTLPDPLNCIHRLSRSALLHNAWLAAFVPSLRPRWSLLLLGWWLLGGVALAQTDSTQAMAPADSIGVVRDSLPTDSLPTDSLPTDSQQVALADSLPPDSAQADPASVRQQQIKDSLQANSDLRSQVSYQASDSIVFDVRSNRLLLYREANLDYEDFNLKARTITVNLDEQELFAEGEETPSGQRQGEPVFTQGEESYTARTMAYNFESGKARVTRGRLVQQDIYVQADVAKYQPDGSFHGADGKFTTCDLEDPHFYIQAKKLKVLPNRQIITGPLRPVVGDFPLPIYLPFGFIPGNLAQKGKKRGLITPQYGNADDRGFFLRNLGYYLPINDYLDLAIEGDIYTRGGWRLAATTNYRIRYRFSGSFSFQYGIQRFNERTDPDFSRTAAWSLRWSHNQPIDPTARFNASVNISSSRQFRQINVNDPGYFDNNLNSSIAFQKNFNNLPFSLNVSGQHRQDLRQQTVSIDLPSLTFNMNRQTPFRDLPLRGWSVIKQLGIDYNMQARNSLANVPDSLFLPIIENFNDTIFFVEGTGENAREVARTGQSFFDNGLQHSASATTTAKILDYINLSPNFSYNETWYLETTREVWNPDSQAIETFTVPGFARAYQFNGSVNANTQFYGIYQLTRTRRKVAFRQRFSPNLGYSLRPDFAEERWGFYETVQTNAEGDTRRYSRFQDGIYGGPSQGEQQAITFSLTSVLEMKYLKQAALEPDFDEDEPFERRTIIDQLSIGSSYNLAADSFKLAPFRLAARTNLFNNRLRINTSYVVDPYVFGYEPTQEPFDLGTPRRFDRLLIEETGQLGRLTNAQVSLQTSFQAEQDRERGATDNFDEVQFQQAQANYSRYVDFAIPWSVNLTYNFNYNRPGLDAPNLTSTVNLSGDLRFGSKWKIQYTTGYDMIRQEFANTTFSVFRDLHCWQLSFRWIPFGPRKSYSLTISAKSSTLSALRLNRNEFWTDRFQN